MDYLENQLNEYLNEQDKENSCIECGAYIYPEKDFCSRACYNANQY